MDDPISRRDLAGLFAGAALVGPTQDPPKAPGPAEAAFGRDYPAPEFAPSWKKPRLNRLLVQDFIV